MNTFEIIVRGPAGKNMDRVRNTILRAVQTDLSDIVNAQVAPGWLPSDAVTLSLRSEVYGKIDEKRLPRGFLAALFDADGAHKANARETLEHYLGQEVFGRKITAELIDTLIKAVDLAPAAKEKPTVQEEPSIKDVAAAYEVVAEVLGKDISDEAIFTKEWVLNTAKIIRERTAAALQMEQDDQKLDDQGTMTDAPAEALELLNTLSEERQRVLQKAMPKGYSDVIPKGLADILAMSPGEANEALKPDPDAKVTASPAEQAEDVAALAGRFASGVEEDMVERLKSGEHPESESIRGLDSSRRFALDTNESIAEVLEPTDPKRIQCDEVREHAEQSRRLRGDLSHIERADDLPPVDPNEDQFEKHRVEGQPDIAPPDDWAAPAVPRKEFVGLVHAKGATQVVESAFSVTIDHAAKEWKLMPGQPVVLRGIFVKEDNGNVPNILESFAATAADVELVYYVENEAGEIVSAQTITEVAFGGLEDAGDDIHFDMYIKAQRTSESFAKAEVAKRHRS